jgi:hypothetical protein
VVGVRQVLLARGGRAEAGADVAAQVEAVERRQARRGLTRDGRADVRVALGTACDADVPALEDVGIDVDVASAAVAGPAARLGGAGAEEAVRATREADTTEVTDRVGGGVTDLGAVLFAAHLGAERDVERAGDADLDGSISSVSRYLAFKNASTACWSGWPKRVTTTCEGPTHMRGIFVEGRVSFKLDRRIRSRCDERNEKPARWVARAVWVGC